MDDIAALIAALNSHDPAQQAAAAEQLAQQGEGIQPALPALVRGVGSPDESVAQWCQAALEEGGPPCEAQIDELLALARSPNPDVAYWAATLLGRGQFQRLAVRASLQELAAQSDRPSVQQRAQWALKQIDQ